MQLYKSIKNIKDVEWNGHVLTDEGFWVEFAKQHTATVLNNLIYQIIMHHMLGWVQAIFP